MWRGRWASGELFGPLPGVVDDTVHGGTLAYEFALPDDVYVPWPGRGLLERVFVLLDLGVSLSIPVWRGTIGDDGTIVPGLDGDHDEPSTWYVDLVHVAVDGGGVEIVVRDLYLDVMVPTDGRHQRILDLDDLADVIEDGTMPLEVAVEGLRRWQAFLDRHLHTPPYPVGDWTDFPPTRIESLAALPSPLGSIVTWPADRL